MKLKQITLFHDNGSIVFYPHDIKELVLSTRESDFELHDDELKEFRYADYFSLIVKTNQIFTIKSIRKIILHDYMVDIHLNFIVKEDDSFIVTNSKSELTIMYEKEKILTPERTYDIT